MTPAQKSSYWLAFSAACKELGLSSALEKESYRKEAMRSELGIESSRLINNTDGFEKIMIRFWHDADRDDLAMQYMAGDARRLGTVAVNMAQQLITSQGMDTDPLRYISGILHQMGERFSGPLSDEWFLDIPESETMKLIQIIDSRRRKLSRKKSDR